MTCIVFGGTGYIGTKLAEDPMLKSNYSIIYLADIREPNSDWLKKYKHIKYVKCDVRNKISDPELLKTSPDWILNFAAIHREPGHEYFEYFETNINGANNVCDFAEKVNCQNILFTSSISVYGPCFKPTDESNLPKPITPYGGSKYPAELIHRIWQVSEPDKRRLVIVRPGVIYGPDDPGNILRMITAIRKGYFVFPGEKDIYKSYGYIYGLIESFHFTMNKLEPTITYNYCEYPTETIDEIAKHSRKFLKKSSPILAVPRFLLIPLSKLLLLLMGDKNPIHPVRVRKAGTPTNIVPKYLIDQGFEFKYDFNSSLRHWSKKSPEDFGLENE